MSIIESMYVCTCVHANFKEPYFILPISLQSKMFYISVWKLKFKKIQHRTSKESAKAVQQKLS